MTEQQIETLAAEILAAHEWTTLPVEPLALAELEQIQTMAGPLEEGVDGRIEYHGRGTDGTFHLYYAPPQPPQRPATRVRFSIAHELGHYFVPAHRHYLVTREWCGVSRKFLRSRRVEREADWFAAALLMPRGSVEDHMREIAPQFCTLDELADLARSVFQTSLISMVLRYLQLDFAPCCAVVSSRERVKFMARSSSLVSSGYCFSEDAGARLPIGPRANRKRRRGYVDAGVWFEGLSGQPLWEELKILDSVGLTLMFLVLPVSADRNDA